MASGHGNYIAEIETVVSSTLNKGFEHLEINFFSKVNKEIGNEFQRFEQANSHEFGQYYVSFLKGTQMRLALAWLG